jgi:metal-responsive CopG/Arc/MetJ family transcriptional regulator
MLKTAKIAISLPKEDLLSIERIRKELGLQRSAAIGMAIRFWLAGREKEKQVKQYEDGYRNKPESIAELDAMERAAAETFEAEGLE